MGQRFSEQAEGKWGFISSEKRILETSEKDLGKRGTAGLCVGT